MILCARREEFKVRCYSMLIFDAHAVTATIKEPVKLLQHCKRKAKVQLYIYTVKSLSTTTSS